MNGTANIVQKLDESLSNQIAAGEVVERPAAVVKELVENALDAGARRIDIELEDGGKRRIVISDDGMGMSRDDALLALQRHTTSKLRSAEDLFAIHTFGFRGEAIPSIASVSRFTLTTRRKEDLAATCIEVEGGKILDVSETGAPVGTRIEVDELFFNVPARRKFLKTRGTELGHISDWLSRLALCREEVGFRLSEKGRVLLSAEAGQSLKERIVAVLGRDLHDIIYPVNHSHEGIRVHGYVAGPQKTSNYVRTVQTFVNGRFVRDRGLSAGVVRAYDKVLPVGRSPICVLFVELEPSLVDVNVHPQKTEVRFSDPRTVVSAVVRAIRPVLEASPWLSPEQMAPRRRYSLKPGESAGVEGAQEAGGTGAQASEAGYSGAESNSNQPGERVLGVSLDSDPRLAQAREKGDGVPAGQAFSDALFGSSGVSGSGVSSVSPDAEGKGEGLSSQSQTAEFSQHEHAQRIARAAEGWLGSGPAGESGHGASGPRNFGSQARDTQALDIQTLDAQSQATQTHGNEEREGQAVYAEPMEVADPGAPPREPVASDELLAELENERGLQVGGRLWQALNARKQREESARAEGGSHHEGGSEGSASLTPSLEGAQASGVGQRRAVQGALLDFSEESEQGTEFQGDSRLRFSELRYLGQILRTFLVCEAPFGLVLLDQHAAHERVLYEQLLERQRGDAPKSQPRLFSITVHLSATESALVEDAHEELAELGFELEHFGGTTWALKSVPEGIDGADPAELLRELAYEIQHFGSSVSREQAKEALLVRTSCHSAVRSGDAMEPQEVEALLKALDGTPFNAQCPHGRPVAVMFDSKQLDLMFRRDYEGTSKTAARDRLGC